MAKQKMVGKVAVINVPHSTHQEIISKRIIVVIKHGEWSNVRLNFSMQANADSPDRFYSLRCDSPLAFDDYDFEAELELLTKLKKAWQKESAPRAILLDGKPYLANCDYDCFIQAVEKLGLQVSQFTNSADAWEWACNLPEVVEPSFLTLQ